MINNNVYPKIILIEPQLGENIGSSARAMLNFGLYDLILVNPRDGWPNKKAISTSAGALEYDDFNVQIVDNLKDAIKDSAYIELFGEHTAATLSLYKHHHDHSHETDGSVAK